MSKNHFALMYNEKIVVGCQCLKLPTSLSVSLWLDAQANDERKNGSGTYRMALRGAIVTGIVTRREAHETVGL